MHPAQTFLGSFELFNDAIQTSDVIDYRQMFTNGEQKTIREKATMDPFKLSLLFQHSTRKTQEKLRKSSARIDSPLKESNLLPLVQKPKMLPSPQPRPPWLKLFEITSMAVNRLSQKLSLSSCQYCYADNLHNTMAM